MVYSTARFRVSRLLGERTSGHPKAPLDKGKPGQHGRSLRRKRDSEYGAQRNAIRALASHYGSDLGYRLKFKKTLRYARETLSSKTHQNQIQAFIENFEMRLDTVVYRLKWAPSMRAARQLVSHGFIRIDGRKATRGHLRPGQEISITDAGTKTQSFTLGQVVGYNQTPSYLQSSGNTAKLARLPAFSEIPYPCTMNPGQVLKFCRRKS